ncbi:MAG: YceI family protein [Flavobacteriales bacterium]
MDGHLKSNDFFGVSKCPTASMEFTKVKSAGKNAYQITADLIIK